MADDCKSDPQVPKLSKRILDLTMTVPLVVVLSPPLALLAVVLRMTGEGRVFFRQVRVGYGGKPFTMYKFVTMLERSAEMPGGDITLDYDPRILPLGHFLRKSKINELPQLWNVLRGDMSLVGPRPIDPRNFALYPMVGQKVVEGLKPGLTGVGSLIFRNEAALVAQSGMDFQSFYEKYIYPDKAALENWYLQHHDMLVDFKVLMATAAAVVLPRANVARLFLPGLPNVTSAAAVSTSTVSTSNESMNSDELSRANRNSVLGILLRKYGLAGTAKILWTDVLFDYRNRVDTFRPVASSKLFDADRIERQNRYVPSTFDLIDSSIARVQSHLNLALSDIALVDYGSGKGKVLIGAARKPFRSLKGIEHSKELHDIAVKNLERLGLAARIQLIHGDATKYSLAPEDRILYFFNPFVGDLLENCLTRIASESRSISRFLIYANPVEKSLFDKYFDPIEELHIQPGSIGVNLYKTRRAE